MSHSKTQFIMGTEITITIFGDKGPKKDLEDVFALFQSLEEEFTRFKPDSSLNILNAKRTCEVSDTFIDVLQKCKKIYSDTDYYFNPLINVSQMGYSKDFHSHEFIPEKGPEVNLEFEKIEIMGNRITLQAGQNLDLGGIVKGYGVDQAKEYLDQKGYKNYSIDAGGDIYTAGVQESGKKIVVGIDSPFIQGDLFATIEVQNTAIATSGTYKRKWKIRDQEYNHIINPLTSMNNNEIISITLLTDKCYLGDAYATACIAMGVEKSLDFLRKNKIDGVIVCANKKVYTTIGMKKYAIQLI